MTINLYQQTSYAIGPDYIESEAERLRQLSPELADWARGYGVIEHQAATQIQVHLMAESLLQKGLVPNLSYFFDRLKALDCLTRQAMWLVVHMSYAQRVYLDGRDLPIEDFKQQPRGHVGGALNMVPAYAGFLAANHLTGVSRDWLIGQGHNVAAIDALQLLTGTALPERRKQYPLDELGLSHFVADFGDTRIDAAGRRKSTLGAHFSAHTAGAKMEGGYLGFAAMQYAHMPLANERLVAFLSDGAFEEQRGADWAARWWRGEDTGLVSPIMIANGRRIDQRTTLHQLGGTSWFISHLRNQGFVPFVIDGRDPAAFMCAIYYMELQLQQAFQRIKNKEANYPVPMPYCIAETVKGFGFPGAGTDGAYDLPLGPKPQRNPDALAFFHQGARALFHPTEQWQAAANLLQQPKKKIAPMLAVNCPEPDWADRRESAMSAIDRYFLDVAEVNPKLRVRIGNSDELRSNGLNQTLDHFRHRVTNPEFASAEAIDGCVITALNEEAVVSACLANHAGLNLVVSYEAFAIKMLRALQQASLFSRQQKEAGDAANWLGFPVVSTALLWESNRNDLSHQEPSLSEALLKQMSDMVRVVFPVDANTAMACLQSCYGDLGVVWNLVVPRKTQPMFFNGQQATELVRDGAICVRGHCGAEIQLVATGAAQLQEALKASNRLRQQRVAHSVVYMLEPGRFRQPRDEWEADIVVDEVVKDALFPNKVQYRLFLSHVRPELLLTVCRPLDLGHKNCTALGFINKGGTLEAGEMLFVNRCTWAHALAELSRLCGQKNTTWLTEEESAAVEGRGDPYYIINGHQ